MMANRAGALSSWFQKPLRELYNDHRLWVYSAHSVRMMMEKPGSGGTNNVLADLLWMGLGDWEESELTAESTRALRHSSNVGVHLWYLLEMERLKVRVEFYVRV